MDPFLLEGAAVCQALRVAFLGQSHSGSSFKEKVLDVGLFLDLV